MQDSSKFTCASDQISKIDIALSEDIVHPPNYDETLENFNCTSKMSFGPQQYNMEGQSFLSTYLPAQHNSLVVLQVW